MKYQIIYADCPWHFKNYADTTASRWVGNHYPVMSVDDICKLNIAALCEANAVLFLWAVLPLLPEAIRVMRAWGFEYKTNAFTWVKTNKNALGLFTGMGYYTRSNAELCLLGVKGKPLPRQSHSVHSVIMSPVQGHSRKPPETRERIVQLFGDLPRIELFARQKVDGWDCWGNEVESDIEL